jgi:ribulose-phosphate 3-epimerase
MISRPLAYVDAFGAAGSDIVVFHVEADDEPAAVIDAIRRGGRAPGIALNPDTPAASVLPYLDQVELLLVMTVHPGWGGQPFRDDVLPKMESLRDEINRRGLSVPIGVDGGVNVDTIGPARHAGGSVMVAGSALYGHRGDLAPVVDDLRRAALADG